MKAIVKPRPIDGLAWPRGFQIIDKAEPRVDAPNDVIIEVYAGAICGTDVGIYQGKESLRTQMQRALVDPITIGHEFSGKIVDAGPQGRIHLARLAQKKARGRPELQSMLSRKTPRSLAQERRFISFLERNFFSTAEMHITCGKCEQCRQGEKHVCRNTIIKGLHDDGAWATYVKVPAENIRLFYRREIPPEVISFMDALGNATHTVLSAKVKDRTVAVLGCGVQGLMATAVAKWAGAKRIYVTDASHDDLTHEKLVRQRFALARRYGANHCFDVAIDSERQELYETVMHETQETGVDLVVEMSGSYKAYEDALRILRMGGTFSLLGIPSGAMPVNFARNIIFPGITIHGVIGRRVFETWDQMESLLVAGLAKELVKSGFVSHVLPLEHYEEGFNAIRSGDAYKVLLKP